MPTLMKTLKIFLTGLGGIALLLVLVPLVYMLCGPMFDGQAKARATEFCNNVQIGARVSTLATLAKANNVELAEWPMDKDGDVRYQAWYSGFLANASTCEIYTKNQIIQSKFTDEHIW
jgi:hypothetical protein